MPAATAAARLKREDCPCTKHDSLFSPWKVLVGPSDWVDHSAGKEGVQRYRTLNLPDNFPGLYELGVARASDEGVRSKRNGLGVVVVYLGQADNVRARLQQYGRTGSHLDTGNPLASIGKAETNTLPAGPGLFREVFSRGFSMMFRCALMGNKPEAEKTEAQLLRVFDYAWNKLQNGVCRRDEILLKLEQGSHRSSLLSRVRYFKQKMFGEKAGIKINRSGSIDISSGNMKHMLPRACTFVGFRPQLVNSGDNLDEPIDIHRKYTSEGNTYGNKQARRRSVGYKVKKIDVTKQRTVPIQDSDYVCGVILENGSCLDHPVKGRKRCELHRGKRITVTGRRVSSSIYSCQVGILTAEPIPRLTENASKSDQSKQTSGYVNILPTTTKESSRQRNSFEGKEVKTGEDIIEEGTYGASHAESQSRDDQPSGRKWFELIKAQHSASSSTLSSTGQGCQARVTDGVAGICGWPLICGARASDGSPCKNQPMAGRKRCMLHKGQRACRAPPPSTE